MGSGNSTRTFGGTAMATMMSTQLQQDAMTGTTYINSMMTSMSLVSLELAPMVVDHPMATLEDVMNVED